MLNGRKLGFIGAGSMAQAVIRGVVQQKIVAARDVYVTNRSNQARLRELAQTLGVNSANKEQIVQNADILVLAVKPKDVAAVMEEIGPKLRKEQIVISVVAAISTQFIEEFCGEKVQVIRTMPNTSCMVGAGVTAISRGKYAGEAAEAAATMLFNSLGITINVPETQIDAVTGLSGSGPAYVYRMVEALTLAGKQQGLAEDVALSMANQTVFGAAKMLLETGEKPEKLRQAVCSPGGTTFAGLEALAAHGFENAVTAAVDAASKRSKEMEIEFTSRGGDAR